MVFLLGRQPLFTTQREVAARQRKFWIGAFLFLVRLSSCVDKPHIPTMWKSTIWRDTSRGFCLGTIASPRNSGPKCHLTLRDSRSPSTWAVLATSSRRAMNSVFICFYIHYFVITVKYIVVWTFHASLHDWHNLCFVWTNIHNTGVLWIVGWHGSDRADFPVISKTNQLCYVLYPPNLASLSAYQQS